MKQTGIRSLLLIAFAVWIALFASGCRVPAEEAAPTPGETPFPREEALYVYLFERAYPDADEVFEAPEIREEVRIREAMLTLCGAYGISGEDRELEQSILTYLLSGDYETDEKLLEPELLAEVLVKLTLLDRLENKAAESAEITAEEIAAYYEANKNRFDRVDLLYVFFPAQSGMNRETAEEIMSEVISPETMGNVITRYAGEGESDRGGMLSYTPAEDGNLPGNVPDFLKEGPVKEGQTFIGETPEGYYGYYVLDVTDGSSPETAELIREELSRVTAQKILREEAEKLLKNP